MKVEWVPRVPPLVPQGAMAQGPVAQALADRLRRGCDGLQGVAGEHLLVILGDADSLPWVDGLVYIAPDPLAPRLWTSVHQQTNVPMSCVAQRIVPGRFLLWEGQRIPLDDAGPIDVNRLPSWD